MYGFLFILVLLFLASLGVGIWDTDMFGGVFYRRLFQPGMMVEVWRWITNEYGVLNEELIEKYGVLDVDLEDGTLTLQTLTGERNSFSVTFSWLFSQFCARNEYGILKDTEGNIIKKFG